MARRLRRLLTTLVLAVALLPLSAAAVPTDTLDTTTTVDEAAVEQAKLLRLLNADSMEEQERAIGLISHYAYTEQHEGDFFRLMITPLHYIVAQGDSEPLRIMAVSALYNIGTDAAMNGLAAQIDAIRSERVRITARNALAAYDGTPSVDQQKQTAE